MILYNTTIKVEQTIHEEWLEWMKKNQIPAYVATGLFLEYKLCRILGDDDEHGVAYALQFLCPDQKTFQIYQTLHARRLQQIQAERFPNKYVTFRTLMEVVGQS